MTEIVCRRTGRTLRIGERLDPAGHGAIYAVEPSSDLVLKQYRPEALDKRPELEARIKAMIADPPAYRTSRSDHVSCAWPVDAAYISGRFVGFLMPRVDTRTARTIREVATSPDTTWSDRVATAENLARVVALLHDGDVVVGEFRESNLLTWSDHRVTLLGCDRMQVQDRGAGKQFPCSPRGEEFTAPELLHALLSGTLRTSSSDIFCLAVELHLLLLGEHPFRGEWTGPGLRPAETVLAKDGLWCHAGDPRLAPTPGATPLAVLPVTLQRHFRAAFVDGARNPTHRPAASEWLAALVGLRKSLVACARKPDHVYSRDLSSCPWCPPDARSLAQAERSIPAGYLRPLGCARPLSGAATARTEPASTLPAGHDVAAVDPGHPLPTPPSQRRKPRTPPHQPGPSSRRRGGTRVAAWAAMAAVAIGGVIGVAQMTGTSGPAGVGPAPAASTGSASTDTASVSPSPVVRSEDPAQLLERIRAQDAATVETLAESWVAQLSARSAPSQTADKATTDAAILAGHDILRRQYPGAVLLWSPNWNYDGQFWVTVMSQRFITAEEANAWCDEHGFAPRECHAKRLSHSGVVNGSARYR
jgi:eukaryotic-like serine/threonine-protein kinase